MNEDSFFEALKAQYAKKLPFVVYSRPINSIIKCWLQNDDKLHKTSNFIESGFVFAPFNLNENSILLPEEECKHMSIEIDILEDDFKQSESKVNTHDGRDAHIYLVNSGKAIIDSRELGKVVLSRQESKILNNPNPIAIFKRLFNTYKSAMVYCWYHPKVGLWLGATPELLLKVEGKHLTTISLAGTKPYDPELETQWTSKELEEQQIVTDYIVNEVAPYVHDVKVSALETTKAGQLLHLKTRITGRLTPEASSLSSIIEALHPTPAICGFPKDKAKTFILQNEGYQREYYTGFLGELNLKQTTTRNPNRRNVENNAYSVIKTRSNFYVNLRCMQIKDNEAFIYVGGGITKDSNPEQEWEETVNKTKTIGKVLD